MSFRYRGETPRVKMLSLRPPAGELLRVLCLGAHSDDVEIGCGATMFSLMNSDLKVDVHWAVFGATGDRESEARHSAGVFLTQAASRQVDVYGFTDSFFPYEGAAIKREFQAIKARFVPDVVFTHRGDDRHQDHRVISELTWNTFRDHLILEYEVPKYDGDLGHPNVFVPVDDNARRRKVEVLMDVFRSQRDKRWFSPETFDGLMRIRGVECASPTGYAEGFYVRKLSLGA
jgi:LmbE family N-acetylglucosaminyl deacetylase